MKSKHIFAYRLMLVAGCAVPSVALAHGQSFIALGLGFYIALAEFIGFCLLLAVTAGSVSRFLKSAAFFIGCTVLALIAISLLGMPFSSDVLWNAVTLVLGPILGLLATMIKFGIGAKFWKRAIAEFPPDPREHVEEKWTRQ